MQQLAFEHIRMFLQVVDSGTFSGAARLLNRPQSVVTYTIKRLEEQVGTPLFDRSGYRPILTEAGHTLLAAARRISDAVGEFDQRARDLAQGYEREVGLIVDVVFLAERLQAALAAFGETFPGIPVRLYVEAGENALRLILEGMGELGVLNAALVAGRAANLLQAYPAGAAELSLVVASSHPLAAEPGPIGPDALKRYTRLVVGTRAGARPDLDYGMMQGYLWFVNDLAVKRALLLRGIGWGLLPQYLVEDDLHTGRLVRLEIQQVDFPAEAGRGGIFFPLNVVHRMQETPGPATRWLQEFLSGAATERSRVRPGIPVAAS